MTKEMFVSLAPCAQAMTLIPERPSVPKSLPAIPGVCFMFSPTMATVAKPFSASIGNIEPSSISFWNSRFKTRQASSASSSWTPILVLFSLEAWLTINTLMPLSARQVKMRRFTPITPTIERPDTVMSVVPLMLEIPLMLLESSLTSSLMMEPGASGLNVFLTRMGMCLMQTG